MRATRRRSQTRWLAAAAAAIVAVVLIVPRFPTKPVVPPAIVANVQAVHGSTIPGLAPAQNIIEQTWIETRTGGTLSLDWNGATLRLDEGTRLRLDGARTATLERGAVYFDGSHAGVTLRTPLGEVRDIGTRFEVRLAAETLRVRVREGRVDLRRGNERLIADAATELIASRAGVERKAIAVSGDEWKWIEEAAPPMRLEGLTLAEAVARVAREKGLRAELSGVDGNARLHGSAGFTPDEALDAATAAMSATYHIERGTLIVRGR
jgi:ferric-dicitrate binding protein FerR (iron transport regulator)